MADEIRHSLKLHKHRSLSVMASSRSRSVRFQYDVETAKHSPVRKSQSPMATFKKTHGKNEKELTRVFSEDYGVVEKMILDPRGPVVNRWNKVFLVACLISLFVDPLFFYLPVAKKEMCIDTSAPLELYLTIVRSVVDAFYVVQILLSFRIAYVAPSSHVFGRGELIIDSSKIASRYLRRDLWIHLLAALPLLQLLIWAAIPNVTGEKMIASRNVLPLVTIFQYLLRLYLIFPLSSRIIKANGVMLETAWAGAAYNLMLYTLASHVIGACWYLLSTERQGECWKKVCSVEFPSCYYHYLDCRSLENPGRAAWLKSSNISSLCDGNSEFFEFGIYGDAFTSGILTSMFFNKYYYCLWWGLRNLSSLGQNLLTSTYIGEINFAVVIAILGLVLFALLIGNMQMYLQSTTMRLEEWRIRRTDTERWMRHRQLPPYLKQSVRRYDQYRWVTTRGVDEESILTGLPSDLRRDIKRHLCLALVRQVPLFDQMDDRMLDAICERLKPSLCTPGTSLVREGDPVNEMLFIIRGRLESDTTNGGRTGFFNSCCIGPGDFCGEELLTWALDPRPGVILPSSTRTVKAISEVEAFALIAEDLKFVASQFRRLHSKQVRYTFRFHSHQWRTWAACFIQAAWFRYKKRREANELREILNGYVADDRTGGVKVASQSATNTSFATHTAKVAAGTRRLIGNRQCGTEVDILSALRKPVEPDFSVEDR